MLLHVDQLQTFCESNTDPEMILNEIEKVVTPIIRPCKLKKVHNEVSNTIENAYKDCDNCFDNYKKCSKDDASRETTELSLE